MITLSWSKKMETQIEVEEGEIIQVFTTKWVPAYIITQNHTSFDALCPKGIKKTFNCENVDKTWRKIKC